MDSPLRVFIGSALLALLLSYALTLRHKRRGLLLRFPLLIVGLAAGCLAGVLLYDFYDFMPLVTNSSYKIRVLPGLYLLLVSSLVVVIAAFVPTRHISTP